jgi:ABC-type branched-subunit amino acid transport system ATPase component
VVLEKGQVRWQGSMVELAQQTQIQRDYLSI